MVFAYRTIVRIVALVALGATVSIAFPYNLANVNDGYRIFDILISLIAGTIGNGINIVLDQILPY